MQEVARRGRRCGRRVADRPAKDQAEGEVGPAVAAVRAPDDDADGGKKADDGENVVRQRHPAASSPKGAVVDEGTETPFTT